MSPPRLIARLVMPVLAVAWHEKTADLPERKVARVLHSVTRKEKEEEEEEEEEKKKKKKK